MIAVRALDLSADYGAVPALRGVSFDAGAGEVVGLVGPNGAGKSTLVRLCCGLLAPSAGRVEILGVDAARIPRRELARQVALVPQAPAADLPFTVGELVLMGRAPHLGLFGLEGPPDLAAARRAMEETDVLHLAARRVCDLSGGERQRAFVAKALAQSARILCLDEPTAHLDIGHQIALCALLRRLSAQGTAVVAVLHDLNLAALTCDRILLLQEGRPVAYGPPREVLTVERVEAVFGTRMVTVNDPESGSRLLFPRFEPRT